MNKNYIRDLLKHNRRFIKSKKLYILLLLLLIHGMSLLARDFTYEGIIYTVLDENTRTCETKAGTWKDSGNPVEDNIIIPTSVSDGYNNFKVIGIGENSFRNCKKLTSINIPESELLSGPEPFTAVMD